MLKKPALKGACERQAALVSQLTCALLCCSALPAIAASSPLWSGAVRAPPALALPGQHFAGAGAGACDARAWISFSRHTEVRVDQG